MNLQIQGKYLLLPVNMGAREKKILFNDCDGQTVFDITIPLDTSFPKFNSCINVERFIGKSFEVIIEPEASFECQFSDSFPIIDSRYYLRPFVHYTAMTGWLSDPNGLFFYNGVYHLFYQYNPGSTMWGNMHWGHAVSTDLLHWKEMDPALFPDTDGAMFSGSAYVDTENTSQLRLNIGDPDPILLFYTSAGGVSEQSKGKQFTQCLAYSLDGGDTFVKYARNPIIDHVCAENRDPKVTWAAELQCYVLALFLANNHYALFTSTDLFHWRQLQTLLLTSDTNCPDFYPMTSEDGEHLWIFSGGQDYYTVGRLTERGFSPLQNVRPLHFGTSSGCSGQTFSFPNSIDCGSLYERRIRMVYQRVHMSEAPYENQMGIPMELSLSKVNSIYRLRAMPVREIESLYINTVETNDIILDDGAEYHLPLSINAHDLTLTTSLDGGNLNITVFGICLDISPSKNKIFIDNTQSSESVVPLSFSGEKINVRLILDTTGLEIFADNGLIYATVSQQADFSMAYIHIITEKARIINKLCTHALRSPC